MSAGLPTESAHPPGSGELDFSPPKMSDAHDRSRPLWRTGPVLAGAAIALACIVVATFLVVRPSSDVGPVDLSTGSGQATNDGASSRAEEAETSAAKRRFIDYIALRDRLVRDPAAALEWANFQQVYDFAVGREIDVRGGTLESMRRINSYFVDGRTEIPILEVVDTRLNGNPATITMWACLDKGSFTEYLRGKEFHDPTGRFNRYKMDITMQKVNGTWFIENTSLGTDRLRSC